MTLLASLDEEVTNAIGLTWDTRDGRLVPGTDEVALLGAVKLDATVLYADLSQSSKLATEFHQSTSARIIRCFLRSMSRLIREHEGTITAFDGDRVMGVFVGDLKNSRAATCALKMNYVVSKIIGPKVTNHFASLRDAGFAISHCAGIDTKAQYLRFERASEVRTTLFGSDEPPTWQRSSANYERRTITRTFQRVCSRSSMTLPRLAGPITSLCGRGGASHT
jgi:hypothetical protein